MGDATSVAGPFVLGLLRRHLRRRSSRMYRLRRNNERTVLVADAILLDPTVVARELQPILRDWAEDLGIVRTVATIERHEEPTVAAHAHRRLRPTVTT